MKTRILLLGFLIFTITFSFGQVKTGNGNKGFSGTATGDRKPNQQVTPTTSGNIANSQNNSVGGTWEGTKWISNWMSNDCYNGIKYRVINYNHTNSNGAHWGIMVQNTYGQPASFEFRLIVGGTTWAGEGWDTAYMLGSGKIYTHSNSLVNAMLFNSNSTTFQVEIKKVKLNDNPIDCQGRILPITTNKNSNNQNTEISEHDRIYGTNTTNQNTTQSNQQAEQQRQQQENQTVTNSSSNTTQNNQIVIEPDKSYEMTKQVFEITSNYVNSLKAQAEMEKQKDAEMESKELIKLGIDSDFNEINSPEDYDKVSLTSINYKNLVKIQNIEVKKICATALSDPSKAKEKIKISTKIESAFLGGNTVNVKIFDIGRKFDVGKCAIEIFGTVQTNKVLNFEEIKKILIAGKYEILNVYKFKKNDDEFNKEKFIKEIEITEIKKNGNFIEITANTKNTKIDKFRLINFDENQFVLFYQDKDKLFNYIIKTN